ncbi:hypothetical protein [uncultured Vibrio sp.]|uniref:hypothetical protein n=1 Tax=uncultured Vibrio sp. TaxID=114054 RepID=UPI002AAB5DD2|nr:hypothetical protein [uncultured Vibrio sp.]
MLASRRIYHSLIHHGVKALLMDRIGHYTEEEYHQFLNLMTGQSSSLTMTNEELATTVNNLLCEGYLEDVKTRIPQYQNVA